MACVIYVIPSGFGFVCGISIIVTSLRDWARTWLVVFPVVASGASRHEAISCCGGCFGRLVSIRPANITRDYSTSAPSQRHYASSNFHNSRISWLVVSNSSSVPSDSTLPSFSTMMWSARRRSGRRWDTTRQVSSLPDSNIRSQS